MEKYGYAPSTEKEKYGNKGECPICGSKLETTQPPICPNCGSLPLEERHEEEDNKEEN